jgi:hypothetical protein
MVPTALMMCATPRFRAAVLLALDAARDAVKVPTV